MSTSYENLDALEALAFKDSEYETFVGNVYETVEYVEREKRQRWLDGDEDEWKDFFEKAPGWFEPIAHVEQLPDDTAQTPETVYYLKLDTLYTTGDVESTVRMLGTAREIAEKALNWGHANNQFVDDGIHRRYDAVFYPESIDDDEQQPAEATFEISEVEELAAEAFRHGRECRILCYPVKLSAV